MSSSLICFSTIALMASVALHFSPLPCFQLMEPVAAYLFKKSWIPCLEATIPSSNRHFPITRAFKPLQWKNTICNLLYDENTIPYHFVETRGGTVLIANLKNVQVVFF